MCELFGLSSSRPVSPRELLCRFGERGGDVADNLDGWGLATLQDGVFSTAKEPNAAAQSAHFQGLCEQTFSALIVGHVRKANPPTARVLANTHPFRRTCCGRDAGLRQAGEGHDAHHAGDRDQDASRAARWRTIDRPRAERDRRSS
jgi:predicted glutamine amidotransferase